MSRHPDQNVRADRRRAPRPVRLIAMSVCAALTLGLAACGDDDDETPEDAFCAAGDSLRSDVQGLGDVDVVRNGTSALDEQLSAIQSDVAELRDSGSEVAADEIDALDTAVGQLEDDLSALGDDVSAQGARDVASAASGVVSAARAVLDTLRSTCP